MKFKGSLLICYLLNALKLASIIKAILNRFFIRKLSYYK